jgi:hypothetical protein
MSDYVAQGVHAEVFAVVLGLALGLFGGGIRFAIRHITSTKGY